jgi:hypothetical protein
MGKLFYFYKIASKKPFLMAKWQPCPGSTLNDRKAAKEREKDRRGGDEFSRGKKTKREREKKIDFYRISFSNFFELVFELILGSSANVRFCILPQYTLFVYFQFMLFRTV